MESCRICSFTGCSNTSFNQNCSFYEYPEDFSLCIQWIEIISSREYFEDFAFRGPDAFRGRFICSDHFTEEDFIDSNNMSSGLKKDAVPFYFIPNRKTYESTDVVVKTESSEEIWDYLSNSSFSVDFLGNVKVEDASSQFMESGDATLSSFLNLNKKSRRAIAASIRSSNESVEKRLERRQKSAERASLRRELETQEEKKKRRKENAERQAKKRMKETPEQREIRRVKDLLRARQRRQNETEDEAKLRRRYDAARTQTRRKNESEEEKNFRRMKELERVTRRRKNETEEERVERLRKNREYKAKKRHVQRLEQEFSSSKDFVRNNCLTLENLDRESIAINGNFLQSLDTSDAPSSSLQDSRSFDETAEESMKMYLSDSNHNPVENLQQNRYKFFGLIDEISSFRSLDMRTIQQS